MPHENSLLRQFSATELMGLRLEPVQLPQHLILFDAHQSVSRVYFPVTPVVSLVVPLSTGELVETAMVGHDGIIGAAAALNGSVSHIRAVVELPGAAVS